MLNIMFENKILCNLSCTQGIFLFNKYSVIINYSYLVKNHYISIYTTDAIKKSKCLYVYAIVKG